MGIQDTIKTMTDQKWLAWKVFPKGTHLTVVPDLVPEGWNIREIEKVLVKNKIVNYDISKIASVIKEASGKMELIGPPFELFEEGKRKYLRLQATPIQVRFSIDVGIFQTDYQITKADVSFILAEKSVTYGVDYEIIEEILAKEIYGPEFIIATATPPVIGTDASINEIIPIDPDVKPFLDENGNVDYKKWDNIRQIKKDELICIRIPPTPGIPGTSVYGMPLSPTPGEDYALPAGINTKIIDNETKLVASINGFLYRHGRDICVGNIYIINGDVCTKTGNIEYSGDVLVKGSVGMGFSVIADGNVSIDGFVEGAYVESRKSNVFLKGSVFGQNKTIVRAAKNLTAENIQDCTIQVGKNLLVKGLLMNSKVEAENLNMPITGSIISCNVAFRGQVKCGTAGGKSETLNEFIFVENEREQFKEELQKYNVLSHKLSQAIEALQIRLLSLNTPLTPEQEEQKKLFLSQLSTCNYNKEQVGSKRKKLIKLIETMPDKDDLIIIRKLSPKLKISIFGVNKEFKQDLIDLKIGWRNGSIKMESI